MHLITIHLTLTDRIGETKVTQPTFKKVGAFMCSWLCDGRGSEAKIRQPPNKTI
ncbi:hypothetical protein BH09CHL1_BH09CHL1_06590 [soil metagenome]